MACVIKVLSEHPNILISRFYSSQARTASTICIAKCLSRLLLQEAAMIGRRLDGALALRCVDRQNCVLGREYRGRAGVSRKTCLNYRYALRRCLSGMVYTSERSSGKYTHISIPRSHRSLYALSTYSILKQNTRFPVPSRLKLCLHTTLL